MSLSLEPSAKAFEQLGIDTIPGGEIFLRGRDEAEVTFFFRPQNRIQPFREEVVAKLQGVERRIMVLSGACLGIDLKLATDNLPFGTVTLGSRVSKRIQLENTGDVGTKFSWDTAAFGPHFSVAPAEGFLAPGQDVKLEVTFVPRELSSDIRVDRARMKVEGGADKFLTLTGSCVTQEAQADVVRFQTSVRNETTQSVSIKNPSSSDWQLRPVIQNDFWSGPEFLSVKAGQSATYTLVFRPLSMSAKDKPHEGSIFFPLPDGTGLLYKLLGAAEQPQSSGTVEKSMLAKQLHVETVKVVNWDKRSQRFQAVVELQGAHKSASVTCQEYIDVPGLSDRDFKLHAVSFVEGKIQGRVTFRNISTEEYMYYDLNLTVGKAQPRGSLSLDCPVRQLTSAVVQLENPLGEEVTVTAAAPDPQVQVGTASWRASAALPSDRLRIRRCAGHV